jgi:hypothetical protein
MSERDEFILGRLQQIRDVPWWRPGERRRLVDEAVDRLIGMGRVLNNVWIEGSPEFIASVQNWSAARWAAETRRRGGAS